jgi:hypothetical protein
VLSGLHVREQDPVADISPLMISLPVVVGKVLPDSVPEEPFPERDEMIEAPSR